MSKFILTLDASQISTFQWCPLSWWYSYKENLIKKGIKTTALDTGTLVHSLLDIYYNLRAAEPNVDKLIQASAAIESFKLAKLTQDLELENFLCQRFLLYVQRYLSDDFNVIVNNGVSGVELGFSKVLYEDSNVLFIVEGRIDLINYIQGDIPAFTDHKSQSRFNELYGYTPQFKTYAWATGYEYGIVNYFGLQDDKDNKLLKAGKLFRRTLIHFEPWMIQEWELKMLNIFWDIKNLIDGPMIELAIYNVRNDNSCAGSFNSNPCQFTDICEIGNFEMKQKIKEFKYNKKESWTPWEIKA